MYIYTYIHCSKKIKEHSTENISDHNVGKKCYFFLEIMYIDTDMDRVMS